MADTVFLRTIRYGLNPSENPATIDIGSLGVFGSGSIYIGENSPTTPVKFRSANVYWTLSDSCVAGGLTISQGTTFVSGSMGGGAYQHVFRMGTAFNTSNENFAHIFGPHNVVNIFTGSFGTAKSQSFELVGKIQGTNETGVPVTAVYSWVDITYEYSSSADTRMNTVCIPLMSSGSMSPALPLSQQTWLNIPKLSGSNGWLEGYGDLSIKNSYIELIGNNNIINTSETIFLSCSFDMGTIQPLPRRVAILGTNMLETYAIPYTGSYDSAHTFQVWVDKANRYRGMFGRLWVTYEYNPTTTTKILNNLRIPFDVMPQLSSVGLNFPIIKRVSIPEPNPIKTKCVAAEIYGSSLASARLTASFNEETSDHWSWYQMDGFVNAGQGVMLHTSSQASLMHGGNDIKLTLYGSTSTPFYGITGQMHLLYHSSVPSGGIDLTSRMVVTPLYEQSGATGDTIRFMSASLNIPNTYYKIHNVGIEGYVFNSTQANVYMIGVKYEGGYYSGSYVQSFFSAPLTDAENETHRLFGDITQNIIRHYGDLDVSRINLETQTYFFYANQQITRPGMVLNVGYHSLTSSLAGTISNSNGGVITASLYRADTGELYQKTYRTGDGSYLFAVYDDHNDYYVDVYEDNTYKGRSKTGVAATDFNVSLYSAPGSEHSYTFIG